MTRALIRRTAIALIALLGFAHASLALAACAMERAMLPQAIASGTQAPCADSDMPASRHNSTNGCVAHCTADLQLSGNAVALVGIPTVVTSWLAPRCDNHVGMRSGLEGRPPGTPPSRILLHSFLV